MIAWLAEQPWCTGAVGMTGVSWGGFAALQAASRNPPALKGDRPDPRLRRPLRRRRPLLRRLRAGDRHAALVDLHGRLRRPAAGPRGRRRRLARALGRADRVDGAVGRDLARAPAPRRLLAPGLGLRALRRHHLPGVRDRRLVRRLPRHGAADARARPRARARADRAVGAQQPGVRLARPRDRLPPGAGAVLRRRAEGGGERLLRRAGAGQLPAGADRARPAVRGAARPLGRRPGVAVAARRGAAARARRARALAARAAAHRRGGRRLVRRRQPGRRRRRPAAGGRRVAVLGHAAARRAARAARPRGRRARADRRPPARARGRAAVRGRARRHVDADRARRAQPHASRRARPRRPARARRAGARPRPDAVDVLRRARGPRAAARALADLLAVDLAVARAGDADRRGRDARAAGARAVPARRRAAAVRRARDRARDGEGARARRHGRPDRPPRPRDGRARTSSSRGSTTATR